MAAKKRKRAEKKPPAKVGRPRLDFDVEQFEALCKIHCTEIEIAAVLKMSVDTLERRVEEIYDGRKFAEVFKEKAAMGKMSLRRAQIAAALGDGKRPPNPTMLIWLGKQHLGQRDKTEVTGVDGGAIKQEVKVENAPPPPLDEVKAELALAQQMLERVAAKKRVEGSN